MLYPYRETSVKNQQRWHFGTLGVRGGPDPSLMQTECLVEGDGNTSIEARIRFLRGEIETGIDLAVAHSARQSFSFTPLEGEIEAETTTVNARVFRLTLRITNTSTGPANECAMLSTHTLLGVNRGRFISS